MAKEIERKFLLTKGASIPIPDIFLKLDIRQAYITAEKGKQVRVRITKNGAAEIANICVKYTAKLVRDEFEVEMPLKEAKQLYSLCTWAVEKKRLTFVKGSEHYDIDTFPNKMVFVEVEFKSVKDMKKWDKPSWIGKEITGVSKFSNITLAKKKLKWQKKKTN